MSGEQEQPFVYLDASALIKLVVEEPETAELKAFLGARAATLATSAIAFVEVCRATAIADPTIETQEKARRFLDACYLIGVGETILRGAAQATSRLLRTLDAIHLVTAQLVAPDMIIVYDRRLQAAAADAGLAVASPGA